MTTTDIAVQNSTSTIELAKLMATSTLLPRAYQQQPANLLFAFEYADAIGIPRINALTSIHVIDGKPTASADLIAALVRRAGHKLRIEGDDTYAEVTIIRADDPGYEPKPIRWDEAKARKAGKWGSKGPWSNYPGAMLRSRAITEAARMWASDALYGVIYTPEEVGAQIDEDGAPVRVEATVGTPQPQHREHVHTPLEQPAEPPTQAAPKIMTPEQFSATLQQIAEATTQDDLDAIFEALRGTDLGEHKDGVAQAWNERAERLANPQDAEPTLDDAAAVVQETLDAEVVDA